MLMPITFEEADNHAPFPHRLVNGTFVICSRCDHWINRPQGTCRCTNECHAWFRDLNVIKIDALDTPDPVEVV